MFFPPNSIFCRKSLALIVIYFSPRAAKFLLLKMLLGKEEFGTVSKFLMFYTTYICYRYYMVSRKQLKVTGVPSMLYTSIYITPGPTYKKGLFCVITELAQTLVFRQ